MVELESVPQPSVAMSLQTHQPINATECSKLQTLSHPPCCLKATRSSTYTITAKHFSKPRLLEAAGQGEEKGNQTDPKIQTSTLKPLQVAARAAGAASFKQAHLQDTFASRW